MRRRCSRRWSKCCRRRSRGRSSSGSCGSRTWCGGPDRTASRELEVANARPPIKSARRGIVFVGEPESAVVHRVNCHRAIITPTVGSAGLAAGAGNDSGFTLRQGVYRITHQTARVSDLGINSCTGGVKAKREISRLVHRYTAHPAPGRIGLIGALLKDRYRPRRYAAQFDPAYAGHPARADAVIGHHGFVIAKIPIRGPVHQPIAKVVKVICRSQLRHASAGGWAKLGKAGRGRIGEESKGSVSGCDEIGVEMIYLINTAAGPFHE